MLTGRNVLLYADLSLDERDSYRGLLRYVWLLDIKLFSLGMIAHGFAHEYISEVPYLYLAVSL